MIVTSYVVVKKNEHAPRTSLCCSLSGLSRVRKGKILFFLLSSIFLNRRSGYGNVGCGKSLLGRMFYTERHLRFHKIGKTNVKMYFVKFYIVPAHRMV